MVRILVSVSFGYPQLENTIKTNCINVQSVVPDTCHILAI